MQVRLLSKAKNDLITEARFYEEKQTGLGDYFLSTLYADIDSLVFYAGIHMKQYGFYRLLATKFSCAIYYDIIDNIAVVSAVLDTRRDPKWIKEKLNEN
ncbi:MAG: type II toxin-antitoxin system RelE/ParE family toxin [Thermodesulfobacteriota bacterium]|nr:type II toxin-antitoxin system RelE/ParE family toxin [Thermodesulfobacteriota bacterium]